MNIQTPERRESQRSLDTEIERDPLTHIFRRSIFWTPERQAPSAWIEHVPFAFWLVDVMRPRTIVELGTHNGVSYSAMCQAVKSLELATSCFAIDTWKGDEHAGFYPEGVYSEFAAFHDQRYSAFSRLVRSSFDEALSHFEDGSIDLLHIDGLHTYEAVRHDYQSWLPKLSTNAVVLFHDTNVRERDFGVFRLWSEITADRLYFSFLHGYGLGVLGQGRNYSGALSFLFNANDDDPLVSSIREIFGALGRSVSILSKSHDLNQPPKERNSGIGVLKHSEAKSYVNREGAERPSCEPTQRGETGRAHMTPHSDLSIVVIIPLYNGARWIEQSIQSVLSQTLRPNEFIVVDDGSTDDGPAVVERLAHNHPIRLLRKPNGGQSSARNFGVAHSTSALIALLDQDDAWYPHHIERLVGPFCEPRDVPLGWVYSNLDEIDESGGMVTRRFLDALPLENPKRSVIKCLKHDLFILPSASLISRTAFEAVGGFDERLSGYEDDDLFLRLFRAGNDNIFIDESLSKWRIYPTSTSYTFRMARSRMIYAEKLFQQFPDIPVQGRYLSRDYIAPRFIHQTLMNCMVALEIRDTDMFRTAVSHLQILLPHLSRNRRLAMSAALMVFGQFNLALVAYKTRRVIRPIARKLLGLN